MRCCGVNSSADWRSFRPEGNSVPDSCCINVTTSCGLNAMTDPNKVYQKVKSAALAVTLHRFFPCMFQIQTRKNRFKKTQLNTEMLPSTIPWVSGEDATFKREENCKINILCRATVKGGSGLRAGMISLISDCINLLNSA